MCIRDSLCVPGGCARASISITASRASARAADASRRSLTCRRDIVMIVYHRPRHVDVDASRHLYHLGPPHMPPFTWGSSAHPLYLSYTPSPPVAVSCSLLPNLSDRTTGRSVVAAAVEILAVAEGRPLHSRRTDR